MLSDEDAKELAENVIALASANIASIELISKDVYDDEDERQILLGYMSVLLTKMAMENVIDSGFEDPLEFRMNCLDAVKEIYDKVTE